MDINEELSLVRKTNIEAFEEVKRRLINHKFSIAKNESIENKLELYTEVDSTIDYINKLLFSDKQMPRGDSSSEVLNRIING